MVNLRARSRRAAAFFLLVASTVAVLAPVASAHASIDSTSPEAGKVVSAMPDENVIVFNEGVSIADGAVRVIDPTGNDVRGIESRVVDGTTVLTTLPELDAQGSYTIAWRAVSADGHPISGAYLVHVGAATLTEPAEAPESSVPLAANILRVSGAVLLLGAAAMLLSTGARGQRWWNLALLGAFLAAVGSVVAVGLGPADSVMIALNTVSGRMAFAALVAAAVGACVASAGAPTLSAALLGLMIVAAAAQGHAVAMSPLWRSTTLTVLHVVAAVGWAAGLLFLLRLGAVESPARLRAAVGRFSPWAAGAVALLLGTGVGLVLGRIPFGELLRYNYGRLSLLKVLLLLVALVLVLVNRGRVATLPEAMPLEPTPSDDAQIDDAPSGDMQPEDTGGEPTQVVPSLSAKVLAGIRAEVLVLALALVVGAVLSQVPPPDLTAQATTDGRFAERLAFGPGELDLTVEPATRGTNEIHVVALDDAGRLMAGIGELKLEMRLPSEDLGPLEPEMAVITVGHSVSYAEIPLAGEWEMTVTGRTEKFQEYTAVFTVPVEP